MKGIKVFHDCNKFDLEKEVNSWIEKTIVNYEVLDFKFSTFEGTNSDDGPYIEFCVMIIFCYRN